jgi:hypothetical protein
VSETVPDGLRQLTVTQPNGPGFFHASLADGAVTVGCSTNDDARECFATVRAAAAAERSLRQGMSGYFRMTVHEAGDGANPITELPVLDGGIERVPQALADLVPDYGSQRRFGGIAAVRVDVGDWSWQWDSIEPADLGGGWLRLRSAFGGQAELAHFGLLSAVLQRVGDEWVQAEFDGLRRRAAEYLGADQDF